MVYLKFFTGGQTQDHGNLTSLKTKLCISCREVPATQGARQIIVPAKPQYSNSVRPPLKNKFIGLKLFRISTSSKDSQPKPNAPPNTTT